jgi:hypothetical protein
VANGHVVETTLEFPYKRSLGPVIGAFLTGLRDGQITGVRTASGTVLVPPLEYNPETGDSVDPTPVPVGPEGEVTTWTWVPEPAPHHPLDHPFAFALIRLDGASTALTHVVDTGDPAVLHAGLRVKPRWRPAGERQARIDAIEAFVVAEGGGAGDAGGAVAGRGAGDEGGGDRG